MDVSPSEVSPPGPRSQECWALAALFFRLGATAFGGPAAHIAMMEDEVVRRRRWLSRAEFLDLLGAAQLIPGPNSTELAIHIGYARAGLAGLLVAGACFIFPAMALAMALGFLSVRYAKLPAVGWLLYGIRPVVVAIILQALWGFCREALRPAWRLLVAVAALAAAAFGVNELWILLGAALVSLPLSGRRPPASAAGFPVLAAAVPVAAQASTPVSYAGLFLALAKIGSLLFGSGYVLVAFLRTELVERRGWLTETQLLDAITVGQVTPGPVFTTATYVGYVLLGPLGALVTTVGIFLPAFVFVALSGPVIPRLRSSPRAAVILQSVSSASLGLMALVSWQLGREAVVDVPSALLAMVSLGLLLKLRLGSTWLILGGAAFGLLWKGVGRV